MKKNQLSDKYKVKSVSAYIRLLVSISTVLTTIIIASIISFHEIRTFKQIFNQQKESYLTEQKNFIRDIVNNEIKYIQNQKKQFDNKVHQEFEKNVQNTYKLAENIYSRYNNKISTQELKDLIIHSISSLETDNKYAKVFISTLEGKGVYYPGKPDFIGKKLLNLQDANGNLVVQSEVDFLKDKSEGFITYSPVNNTGTHPQKKITFVKKFGHFNWYFGSKGYFEDYYKEFRTEIAEKSSSTRFRHSGYIFLNELDGDPIALNGKIYTGNFNFYDGSDLKKKAIFELEVKTAKSSFPDGGYFNYEWEKINSSKPSPKISYVRLFKPYNWLVGAGFYMDDIDHTLALHQRKHKKGLLINLLEILCVLLFILFIEFYLIYRFNVKYIEDFSHFNRFFTDGKGKYKTIKTKSLHFDEFKQMGDIANTMIIEQEKTNKKLVIEKKKAKESDRLKTAFLANMSHEIRTPMNAILGFSELINDPNVECDTKKEFTSIIIENGHHLLELINDIIDISKIESGQLNISRRKFRLDLLIENIEKQFQEQLANEKKSKIKFIVETKLPINYLLNSDELRIKQVLVNLIGNAMKFTQRGSITLTVSKVKNKIYFEVSDTGIGIRKGELETIFQRFVQSKMNTKKNYGGTGLGLAISKNIIETLGGEIDVKSTYGKSSEFYFHIPA